MAGLLDYCLLICAATAGVSSGYPDPEGRDVPAAGWHCPSEEAGLAASLRSGALVCRGGGLCLQPRPKGLEGPVSLITGLHHGTSVHAGIL